MKPGFDWRWVAEKLKLDADAIVADAEVGRVEGVPGYVQNLTPEVVLVQRAKRLFRDEYAFGDDEAGAAIREFARLVEVAQFLGMQTLLVCPSLHRAFVAFAARQPSDTYRECLRLLNQSPEHKIPTRPRYFGPQVHHRRVYGIDPAQAYRRAKAGRDGSDA